MLNVLEGEDYDGRHSLPFLGDAFYSISTLKPPESDSSWFLQLSTLEDCHPTWALYSSAARFLQNVSKESLACELMAIAPLVGPEWSDIRWPLYSQIPWPMAACLNMCNDEAEVRQLARRASSGQLGDQTTWLEAENRWRREGITEEDIRSMSDDRLPFDKQIDILGFPVSLSLWPVYRPHSNRVRSLPRLLSLHEEMNGTKARSMIARLLEACFIGGAMVIGPDEFRQSVSLNVKGLQAVFEDLPNGRSLPLHAIVNQLSGSAQDIAQFFRVLQQRQVNFSTYSFLRLFDDNGLNLLREAFLEASCDQPLVPVFGLLAEYGQLPDQLVRVPGPESFDSLDHKVASLIIMVAQESWEADRTELLLGFVRETAKHGSMHDIYGRIMNTCDENRAGGHWFEKFLLEFGKLLPSENYKLQKRYMLLLENALRRRTSKFADPEARVSFRLPKGIDQLL